MRRDIQRLAGKEHDVLIVGGGIYGATLAREAAVRGLSVAVIDKADFCSATSANSLKIIHGGVRYLQQLDLGRLRQSVRERRTIMRMAPHLVHPLRCAMPTYGCLMKSPAIMRVGLLANDILGWDRNRGVAPDHAIPAGRLGSRAEWLRIAPEIDDPAYTGVALWSDACAYSTERLGLGFVQDAVRLGAEAANYVEMTGFLRSGRNVTGVTALDLTSGKPFDLRARLVVVNTGPWTKRTLGLLGHEVACPEFRPALAINIVLRRQIIKEYAAGLTVRDREWKSGRLFFFVPWRGRTVAGTAYTLPAGDDPDRVSVAKEFRDSLLSSLNKACPRADLREEDIALIHAGLLPAVNRDPAAGEEPRLLSRFRIIDHALSDGTGGLLTVLGVKYTTARHVAQRTVETALRKLGRVPVAKDMAADSLPGGDFDDLGRLVAAAEASGLRADIARQLVYNHGTRHAEVLRLAAAEPGLREPVSEEVCTIGAEIVNAVRNEMALTLSDIVMRRTDLGSAGRPADAALRKAAQLAAAELGWDGARIEKEIESVKSLPAWGGP